LQSFDIIAGVPVGGLLLATALGLETGQSTIYVRDDKKNQFNDHQQIEGSYLPGQTVLVIDDLTTGGHSIQNCVDILRNNGLYVKNAISLIDRAEGSSKMLAKNGISMHSIINLETLSVYLKETKKITENEFIRINQYLNEK